jgi:phage shock protein C
MTQNPNPQAPPYKQLRRPVDDRLIAGVCSGVARYCDVDPNVVRVLFAVIAVLTWGTALLAYPIMWFIMPEERAGAAAWPGANAPISPPHPPPAA